MKSFDRRTSGGKPGGMRLAGILVTLALGACVPMEPTPEGQVRKYRQQSYTDFSWVQAVAFSPDGATLAAAFDEEIGLWSVHSGESLGRLQGHTETVWAAVFSPGGRHLASASEDGSVRLWDTAAKAEVRRFSGPQRESRSVAFSPDGRLVAAAPFREVWVWDTASGRVRHRFANWPPDAGAYDSVFFSDRGRSLHASGTLSPGPLFQSWDVAAGRLRPALVQTDGIPCEKSAISADERRVVTGTQQRLTHRCFREPHSCPSP